MLLQPCAKDLLSLIHTAKALKGPLTSWMQLLLVTALGTERPAPVGHT